MAANKSVRKEMGFLMTTLRKVVGAVEMMLFDTRVVGPVSILILVFEAILLEVIIRRVPYTEIDYSTYMQQVTQIEQGELDYDLIGGDTGPIVYPGGYVFIYSWMKVLTGGMEELWKGQELFRVLYLLTMGLTLAVYLNIQEPYRVPPYVMYLLAISKRLHSIYVLRLFNDCFTTFFMRPPYTCQYWMLCLRSEHQDECPTLPSWTPTGGVFPQQREPDAELGDAVVWMSTILWN
ncbi:hypothetical protein JL09_g624 [Pichia kudriavzevii]|uniref:Dol-P-Man:Man(5)GlcNAc(2)-PP-Dol alpha-1,3-mannosyltransferase n=1 Tax=Pichia kudriavzevii TaxID=4909 RepID=A0A099P572_PICKU|nr:hypothetical protein JL09_g624 [Pichia kudriavzevii]